MTTGRDTGGEPPAESELVALVAHDLRSPLTSVKGFVGTLRRRWDRFSDDQKLAMLATVEADADRIAVLLRTLVEVARIDAGRVALRREPVDVAALATVVADRLAADRDDDRTIDVDIVGTPQPARADRDKLDQVVSHLIVNALTYALDGPVTVTVAPEPGAVRLSVADTGPGIPEELHQHVFDRLARKPDEARPGLGLGLYLVRGLVDAHGGEVWIDADVDAGTTVHIRLPADE